MTEHTRRRRRSHTSGDTRRKRRSLGLFGSFGSRSTGGLRVWWLVAAAFLILLGGVAATYAEEDDPVKLGRNLVQHLGCLFCHGLGGREGIVNPNAERQYVPAWDEAEFIEKYPDPEEVKKTIQEGRFPDKAENATGNPIPMPPWGNRLTEVEMDAIIAYIWSMRDTPVSAHEQGGWGAQAAKEAYQPPLPVAARPAQKAGAEHDHHVASMQAGESAQVQKGKALVGYLGCLHCHGQGDEKGMENPNAERKHVPNWDDEEFARRYAVADGVRYVIEKGRVPEKDPQAVGNPVPMPPFGGQVSEGEMDAIIAYIWSLRAPDMARSTSHTHRER